MHEHHGCVRRHRNRTLSATAVLVTMAVLALGALWSAPAGAVPDPGSAEADFVARINQLRASKGLGTLSIDGELTTQSRIWAATMAGEGRIFHASDLSVGVSADWRKLGENVGVGGDVATLFQAFVDSPSHYANLVDPGFTRIGVGVVVSGDRIYTTHRFMKLAPPPPPPPPVAPTTTVAPTTSTTAAPAPSTTTPRPAPKLGPLERIAELID
jgi:hypothetical protein